MKRLKSQTWSKEDSAFPNQGKEENDPRNVGQGVLRYRARTRNITIKAIKWNRLKERGACLNKNQVI